MATHTRKPAAQRREQIAVAALRIVGERGLTALTTATLAEEVGVTTGALFRHFASREAILAETVRYALDRIEGTFPDASLPPLERIAALARNRMQLLGPDPGLAWLLRSDQAYLALPAAAVVRLREIVERSRRFVLDAVREGAARGTIRRDIEPEVLVVPIMGTIHALIGMSGVSRLAAGGRRRDPGRVLDALRLLLEPPRASRLRPHSVSRSAARSGPSSR